MARERGRRHEAIIGPLLSASNTFCASLKSLWEASDSSQAWPTVLLLFLLLTHSRDTRPLCGDVRISPTLEVRAQNS